MTPDNIRLNKPNEDKSPRATDQQHFSASHQVEVVVVVSDQSDLQVQQEEEEGKKKIACVLKIRRVRHS